MGTFVQRAQLYAAYMLTSLETRGWAFAISLCMHMLGGMQLVSIQQLVEDIAQITCSVAVGRAVDATSDRKWGMILCLIGNNLTVVVSFVLFGICMAIEQSTMFYTVCLLSGIALCSFHRVFIMAEKNASSKDWMLVLVNDETKSQGIGSLAKTNAFLTTLDQLANVIAPVLIGLLMSMSQLRTACFVLVACGLITLFLKGALLGLLYHNNDRLKIKIDTVSKKEDPKGETKSLSRFSSFFAALSIYYNQSVFPAALGFALLYLTVLGFDGLSIGYGESVGLPEHIIGVFRSFGSVAGVAGAISYAVFERHYGVRKTGLVGLILQISCLVLAVVSIWLPGSPWNPVAYFSKLTWSSWLDGFIGSFAPSTPKVKRKHASTIDWSTWTTSDGTSLQSILAFLIGIATSRFGLWIADLSITHLMQISVPESQRNTVFGVHNAMCQAFSVLKDILVIILPSPQTFGICILISFASICTALVSYLHYMKTNPETAEIKKKQ